MQATPSAQFQKNKRPNKKVGQRTFYQEEFLKYGFIFTIVDDKLHPKCVLCFESNNFKNL